MHTTIGWQSGLCDVQVNGYGGIWFSDPGLTVEHVRAVVHAFWRHGTTQLFPTLVTCPSAVLLQNLAVIVQARTNFAHFEHAIPGIHLEGPFVSPLDGPRGAHPRAEIAQPTPHWLATVQAAAGGLIKLLTVAPEVPGVLALIREATAAGIVVAIGHTAATAETIAAAVDAGATLSTHLGNGCATQLHRHRNPLWPQLAEPRLWASLITDGEHLPWDVARSIVLAKTPPRILLTCDASGWAGLAAGRYENDFAAVEILPSGRLVVAGQTELLAGSNATTAACVAQAVQHGLLTLDQAWQCASSTPRQLMGLPAESPETGVRCTWSDSLELTILETRIAGQVVPPAR